MIFSALLSYCNQFAIRIFFWTRATSSGNIFYNAEDPINLPITVCIFVCVKT